MEEQQHMQYLMWVKSKQIYNKNNKFQASSWEEEAFAEDALGPLGGFIWPPRSYSCTFCKREFRSAQALGGHMNVHRRDRARLKQSSSPSPNHHHLIMDGGGGGGAVAGDHSSSSPNNNYSSISSTSKPAASSNNNNNHSDTCSNSGYKFLGRFCKGDDEIDEEDTVQVDTNLSVGLISSNYDRLLKKRRRVMTNDHIITSLTTSSSNCVVARNRNVVFQTVVLGSKPTSSIDLELRL